MPNWGKIKTTIEVACGAAVWVWKRLPESTRERIKAILGEEWEKNKERIFLRILDRSLDKAWDEALKAPSNDESYPPQAKTGEAIIRQHRDHMEDLLKSLPDNWRERTFEDPPAQWAKEADIQQVFISHLLYVAALAQIGGYTIHHSRTRDLCFACLLGENEALRLLKDYPEDRYLRTLVVSTLWKNRFSKPNEDVCIKFRNVTLRGIDRNLIEKNTTQDIITAARRMFSV